jgi:hypothetical protein
MKTLLEDKREIECVVHDTACVTMWSVGKDGITKIECYAEYGECGMLPFLAIWKDDVIIERANALPFRIVYKTTVAK